MGNDQVKSPGNPDPAKGKVKTALLGCIIYVTFTAFLLFSSAGTPDWPMAWVFIVISLAFSIVQILGSGPDLLEDRSRRHTDSKRWDRVLVSILTVLHFCILVTAGLTVRFGQGEHVPLSAQILALILLTGGNSLIAYATWTNRFFSATVRIQNDRGHVVVSEGPYRFIRHPGYAGMIVVNLCAPLVLGSYWAFIPAVIVVVLFLLRTCLEDKALQEELPGYPEFVRQVKYRLVPGVW